MKKIVLTLFISVLFILAQSQPSAPRLSLSIGSWDLQPISLDHLYPTYLADPLGVRLEISYQKMLFSDIDYSDRINQGGGYQDKWVINPAVRISLLRFSPKSNPALGVSFDFGFTTPSAMRSDNKDLLDIDGIWNIAISARPTEWFSFRFSKHHICTHVGDEFTYGVVSSPIDYDPNYTQLPVRDDFVLMAALRPLWFLHNPRLDILRIYGDFGFFLPGVDFLGERFNNPHHEAWLNLQGGAELEYYFKNRWFGGIYSAINVSAYQLNAYSPNISIVGGYIFPQERNSKRLRVGCSYYNGRSLSNQFYNRKEKFVAVMLAFDI